jgi:hypothetical protein
VPTDAEEVLRVSSHRGSHGLLCYRGDYYENLGDDIQSLAALRFTGDVRHEIPIDEIGGYDARRAPGEPPVQVILNGWFTSNPDSWPPSPDIEPLFISLHVSDTVYAGYPSPGPNAHRSAAEVLLSPRFLPYLRRFAPIGCRDTATLRRLTEAGVAAYFSGCLTLTLERPPVSRSGDVCVVDVNCEAAELLATAPEDVVPRVRFETHIVQGLGACSTSERFARAQRLLDTYASASLVITSRIHCALPCLAFGTPVVFVRPERGLSRLSGLAELMRTTTRADLQSGAFRIPWNRPEPNPVDVAPLAREMSARCAAFFSD